MATKAIDALKKSGPKQLGQNDPKVVYMGSEAGPFRCDRCEYYVDPEACSKVSGYIDPGGCCNLFSPAGEVQGGEEATILGLDQGGGQGY